MEAIAKTFGQGVRSLRRRRDLTQQELAELAHVGYTTISRIERGKARTIYLETAVRLAAALDGCVDDLCTEGGIL